jgi:hypothetical protein
MMEPEPTVKSTGTLTKFSTARRDQYETKQNENNNELREDTIGFSRKKVPMVQSKLGDSKMVSKILTATKKTKRETNR